MRSIVALCIAALFASCASAPLEIREEFIQSAPRSILVLPPLDETIEADASYGLLSTVTFPLAENGYYVFPVAVVAGMMRENGLPTPHEMHQVPLSKLHEVFGADAVLYLTVTEWGTSYEVLNSATRVAITGQLVDGVTGDVLWVGSETAVQSSGGGGILESLIGAVVNQVATSISDPSRDVAVQASNTLLRGRNRAWIAGPYSPAYDAQMAELRGEAPNSP